MKSKKSNAPGEAKGNKALSKGLRTDRRLRLTFTLHLSTFCLFFFSLFTSCPSSFMQPYISMEVAGQGQHPRLSFDVREATLPPVRAREGGAGGGRQSWWRREDQERDRDVGLQRVPEEWNWSEGNRGGVTAVRT